VLVFVAVVVVLAISFTWLGLGRLHRAVENEIRNTIDSNEQNRRR
jgi:hypothetical protein